MNPILLTIHSIVQATNSAQEITSKIQLNDIIGIAGIIVTLLLGIPSIIVTWKSAMISRKQLKLSYNMQVFPILSNYVIKNNTEIHLEGLKIQYKDKELSNPCLLALEITNIGNEAIKNPPIKIQTDEDIEIIPGYLEDIPSGYDELWRFKNNEPYACDLQLEYLNPKQTVKSRFFLDNLPKKKISFECPMPNIQIQEVSYPITASYTRALHLTPNQILILFAVFLYILRCEVILYSHRFSIRHLLRPENIVLFVIILLLITTYINIFGIPIIDNYIKLHNKETILIQLSLISVSIILLSLIIFNIIRYKFHTIIVGIVIFLLSLFIHFLIISRNTL